MNRMLPSSDGVWKYSCFTIMLAARIVHDSFSPSRTYDPRAVPNATHCKDSDGTAAVSPAPAILLCILPETAFCKLAAPSNSPLQSPFFGSPLFSWVLGVRDGENKRSQACAYPEYQKTNAKAKAITIMNVFRCKINDVA